MELSRRALMAGVATAGAGAVTPTAMAGAAPPLVDNGADDESRNVRIELTVLGEGGSPLADEPVVLRDPGGTLDVRRGRTGPQGQIVFVESVGPAPCNPLRVVLPRRNHDADLGCHNGYTVLEETVRVAGDGDGGQTRQGPMEVVASVPDGAQRNWPVDTDVPRDYCTTASGKDKPTTGEGAADWFVWNGCGSWKEYAVEPGEPVYLRATTDSASLVDARFELLEYRDGRWESVATSDAKLGRDGERVFEYVPKGERIRVENRGTFGFYMHVYGPGDAAASAPATTAAEPTTDPADAGSNLPLGLDALVWGLALLVGGLLAGTGLVYRGSGADPAEVEQADDAWRQMRDHPDVEETMWSEGSLPEYAVTVDGRRVVASRTVTDDEATVTLEAPLTAAAPGAGFELVADGDRTAMGTAGPLAPDLPESVWRRLDGLRTFGALTVDGGTATVEHVLDDAGDGDPNALQSPDDLVAQATALVDVATAVEDSVLDGDGDDGGWVE